VADSAGIDPFVGDVARRLAREGFAVLVPALGALAEDRPAVRALESAAAFLAREAALDARRIGALGFGRGGTLALLLGCTSSSARALVTFGAPLVYRELSAARPIQPLELLLNLDAPWLAFFGTDDPLVPPADVERLRAALEAGGKHHEIVLGSGGGRGFPRASRAGGAPSEDATLERTLSFLREVL